MTKRDSLTQEQTNLMALVAAEWRDRCDTRRPLDVAAVQRALSILYSGMAQPGRIIVARSPWEAQRYASYGDGENVNESMARNVFEHVNESMARDVFENVDDNVDKTVRRNVHDNVTRNVARNVARNVDDNVRRNVDDNVRYHTPCRSVGASWYALASYVDYYTRIGLCFPEPVCTWLDFQRQSGVFYAIAQQGQFIVSEHPVLLRRDGDGLLHSETGPAIAWSDLYAQYYWHGRLLNG